MWVGRVLPDLPGGMHSHLLLLRAQQGTYALPGWLNLHAPHQWARLLSVVCGASTAVLPPPLLAAAQLGGAAGKRRVCIQAGVRASHSDGPPATQVRPPPAGAAANSAAARMGPCASQQTFVDCWSCRADITGRMHSAAVGPPLRCGTCSTPGAGAAAAAAATPANPATARHQTARPPAALRPFTCRSPQHLHASDGSHSPRVGSPRREASPSRRGSSPRSSPPASPRFSGGQAQGRQGWWVLARGAAGFRGAGQTAGMAAGEGSATCR